MWECECTGFILMNNHLRHWKKRALITIPRLATTRRLGIAQERLRLINPWKRPAYSNCRCISWILPCSSQLILLYPQTRPANELTVSSTMRFGLAAVSRSTGMTEASPLKDYGVIFMWAWWTSSKTEKLGSRPPPRQSPGFVNVGRQSSRPSAGDRKSTRLNSSHVRISYAVFCLKKKKQTRQECVD